MTPIKSRREFLKALSAASVVRPDSRSFTIEPRKEGVEAVLLGSAQDGGVPHAGCTRELCSAARDDEKLRRRSPCLAILDHSSKESFIFDAGPDFDEQMAALPPDWKRGRNPFDRLFLTHAHIGHYTGLQFLGRAVMSTDKLPVHCSGRMARFIRDNGPWSLLVDLENILLNELKVGTPVLLNQRIAVRPINVPHRAEFTDTLAYLITGPEKTLLFLPDIDRWEEMKPGIETVIKEVDIALLDGTFYSADELPGRDMSKIPHPPITQTMDRLQGVAETGEKELVFIHLNHSNLALRAGSKEAKAVVQRGFQLGYDGQRWRL